MRDIGVCLHLLSYALVNCCHYAVISQSVVCVSLVCIDICISSQPDSQSHLSACLVPQFVIHINKAIICVVKTISDSVGDFFYKRV